MDNHLQKLADQMAADQAEIDKRNKEVNAQTAKMEKAKASIKAIADKANIPDRFYDVVVQDRPTNDKIDLLERFVLDSQDILKAAGLGNFNVVIASEGHEWTQDATTPVDQFKPQSE